MHGFIFHWKFSVFQSIIYRQINLVSPRLLWLSSALPPSSVYTSGLKIIIIMIWSSGLTYRYIRYFECAMADINILCNLIECLYPCPACIHSYLFIIYRNQVSDKVDGTRSDSLWKVHHKIRRLGLWNTRGRALYLRSHSLSRFVSMQLVAVQADPILVMISHFYASSNILL